MARIVGNNSANNIVGTFLGDHISGLAGNDVINMVGEMMRSVATAGMTRSTAVTAMNRIVGGTGSDIIYGGSGRDTLGG